MIIAIRGYEVLPVRGWPSDRAGRVKSPGFYLAAMSSCNTSMEGVSLSPSIREENPEEGCYERSSGRPHPEEVMEGFDGFMGVIVSVL